MSAEDVERNLVEGTTTERVASTIDLPKFAVHIDYDQV